MADGVGSHMRLVGKLAVVLGGAGGLGEGIVRRMHAEGARVAVADIDCTRAETLVDQLDATGASARALEVDVSDREDVQRVARETREWAGEIDILVNSAGVNSHYPALELPVSEWDRIIDVNLKGTFLAMQTIAPYMRTHSNASIINISSTSAVVSRATTVHYTASKGGVRALTQGFAVALAPLGIRVNAIGPGPVETHLNVERLSDPAEREKSLARVPMGRLGTPEEVAGLAVFLATEDASYITGTSIYVDGGLLAMR